VIQGALNVQNKDIRKELNYQDRMIGETLPKQIAQYKPKGHRY
jgi:hypothetical protein